MQPAENNADRFEVFYDGDCPLCVREIRFLEKRDRKRGRILFTDIAAADFDAEAVVGVDHKTLMGSIHGRMPDGSLVKGVEVFRQLYSAIGLKPVVLLTRLPVLSQLLDLGYWGFAKNRLRMTGRSGCETGTCAVPSTSPSQTV